ncbi:hypothetical protein Hamer_G008327 [Homarus americanus]|uniref:Uncharacterized protein n=1 Tax=Homarus americanus TaxID=6706 RepID=A0A8J5TMR8_HOMAM|nr:hypothetical protein Hamer_G008327 [Homarus americanus]
MTPPAELCDGWPLDPQTTLQGLCWVRKFLVKAQTWPAAAWAEAPCRLRTVMATTPKKSAIRNRINKNTWSKMMSAVGIMWRR